MGALVQQHESKEVDVVVRQCPGHPDLKDQVGILFIDYWLTGAPSAVTFEPFHDPIPNCLIEVASLYRDGDYVFVYDKDDGSYWIFEVDDDLEYADEGDDK